ncbi:MAG TPA: LuxR C-terminal-related transcriptional regulator [Patescibacteria group bacterium]|nr:LuxR C-terminal-related transcriptional regulator [Patescibacteria group bacterium]
MIEIDFIEEDRKYAATPRQKQVIQHSLNGFVNNEIAVLMGISVKTVEAHKTHFAARRSIIEDPILTSNRALFINKAINGILDRELSVEKVEQKQPLTKREDEIMALILCGMSNTELAAELSISVKTVEAHVSHIRSKLGAHTKLQTVGLVTLNHLSLYPDYEEDDQESHQLSAEATTIDPHDEELSIIRCLANGWNSNQIARALRTTSPEINRKINEIINEKKPEYDRFTGLVSLVTEYVSNGDRLVYNVPDHITLTQKEMNIVTAMMMGADIYEVAEIESLYYKTVDKYLQKIYPRIGARNRAHAFAILVEYSKTKQIEVLS